MIRILLTAIFLLRQGFCFNASTASNSTTVEHIQFAISSCLSTWKSRSHYVRSWWNAEKFHGHLWMEENGAVEILESDQLIQFSDGLDGDKLGNNVDRILLASRVIIEAFRLQLPNIRWIVKGDDDTFFSPYGIAAILSKYDHSERLFIGSLSESHAQSALLSHEMAFGGGGFAVSWPLAAALNATLEKCLLLYSDLQESDQKLAACIAELGVHPIYERGFHQCDAVGSMAGLMEAHFPTVFASLHRVDKLDPIYPNSEKQVESLLKLNTFIQPDPVGFAQQTICYIEGRLNWTVSISWGYSVKVYTKHIRLGALEQIERTFVTFGGTDSPVGYELDTRRVQKMKGMPCELPFAMYAKEVKQMEDGSVLSVYERNFSEQELQSCEFLPSSLQRLNVFRAQPKTSQFLGGGYSGVTHLKRDCCDNMHVYKRDSGEVFADLWISDCGQYQCPGSDRLVLY